MLILFYKQVLIRIFLIPYLFPTWTKIFFFFFPDDGYLQKVYTNAEVWETLILQITWYIMIFYGKKQFMENILTIDNKRHDESTLTYPGYPVHTDECKYENSNECDGRNKADIISTII